MKSIFMIIVLMTVVTAGCRTAEQKSESRNGVSPGTPGASSMSSSSSALHSESARRLYDSLVAAGTPRATFASGCFWCTEAAYDGVPGVIATISGYTGGTTPNPTYEEVSSGGTGHVESVAVFYDSTKTSYAALLDIFWHNVDPLTADRQFCDAGKQYHAGIFYHGAEQKRLADSSKQAIIASRRFDEPIVTAIWAASAFTPAEEYHQDFHTKNPERYEAYRQGCRRDQRLKELWDEK
jgi:peptide-methionine (S)-S-oxide reductase